jgi:uncharacterized membrane protein YobD (UPF0266 family)
MDKWFLQSKTIWLNIVVTLIAVLELLRGQDWIAQNPTVTAWIVGAIAIANIVLRFISVDRVVLMRPRH